MWVIVKMLLYYIQNVWKTSYYSLLDMVGFTIQHSRDPHSQNICIIILWLVEGISIRPVMQILPIIPYLDNFLSSPRLGLISLNHILKETWTNIPKLSQFPSNLASDIPNGYSSTRWIQKYLFHLLEHLSLS